MWLGRAGAARIRRAVWRIISLRSCLSVVIGLATVVLLTIILLHGCLAIVVISIVLRHGWNCRCGGNEGACEYGYENGTK